MVTTVRTATNHEVDAGLPNPGRKKKHATYWQQDYQRCCASVWATYWAWAAKILHKSWLWFHHGWSFWGRRRDSCGQQPRTTHCPTSSTSQVETHPAPYLEVCVCLRHSLSGPAKVQLEVVPLWRAVFKQGAQIFDRWVCEPNVWLANLDHTGSKALRPPLTLSPKRHIFFNHR